MVDAAEPMTGDQLNWLLDESTPAVRDWLPAQRGAERRDPRCSKLRVLKARAEASASA
jgi:hypothetical protein